MRKKFIPTINISKFKLKNNNIDLLIFNNNNNLSDLCLENN